MDTKGLWNLSQETLHFLCREQRGTKEVSHADLAFI